MKQRKIPNLPYLSISKPSNIFTKRSKVDNYESLNKIQITELVNLETPSIIRAFIQQNLPLLEVLSNKGDYYKNPLINLYPPNIRRIIKSIDENIDLIQYSETENFCCNTALILNICQGMLYDKIASVHHETLEMLDRKSVV